MESSTNNYPVDRLQYHAGQVQVLSEALRFNVVACGRRWGKTLLGQDLAVATMLDGFPVAWFSPTYKESMEVYNDLRRWLSDIVVKSNKTERRIEITTGGVIEFWTLDDQDAGRSRKYKRAIIDEAAKAPYLEYSWNYAISPTLIDYEGDAWFLSSTRGRNYFYRLWLRGQDGEKQEWASWQMPTSTNPYIKLSEIEAAREEIPEAAFAQEYLAEFTEAAGAVFRKVRDAVTDNTYTPIKGARYVMGVDWAQSHDFTVFYVMDVDTKEVVDYDRFNQISWDIQRRRLAVMADAWNVEQILAEQNSIGGPNIEALQAEGLPVHAFTTTNESKQNIIVALQLAFERGTISIPDDPILIAELESFEATRLQSGRWRYQAPDGMHDDTVIALALAYEAANTRRVIQYGANPMAGYRG